MAEQLLSASQQHKRLLKEINRLKEIQSGLRSKYKDNDALYKFNLEKANEALISKYKKSNDKYIKNFAKGKGFANKLNSLINRQVALEQYMGSKYRTVGKSIPELVSAGGFVPQEGSRTRGINPDYNEQFDKDFGSSPDTSFAAFRGSDQMNTVRSNLAIKQAQEAENSMAEDAFIESEANEWGPGGQPSAEVQMKLSNTYGSPDMINSAGTNGTSTRDRLKVAQEGIEANPTRIQRGLIEDSGFTAERLAGLKIKQEDFKSMDKQEFAAKYPKSQTAKRLKKKRK